MFKQLLISSLIFGSTFSIYGQSSIRHVSAKDTVTDKELIVPEDIERNFDQLLVDWKKDMEPSDNCYSSDDSAISYPDSVYINRLYSLPTIMELAYNPVVRSYINMYTGRMRKSVGFFLGKSDYYFPIFEQALDRYGLPLELKYLPIIESALNPTIVSKAGATGLWQFMLGTGKMYDLEINSLVDERRDPYRSTDAAARYLKDLYNIYGDWNLVIAAYNCGPGNVNKAIKRNDGQSDYWSIYPYLPKETRGYVPAFIAATYVMNYSDSHNICPLDYEYNSSTDTVVIDKQLHLQQLSEVLNIPIDEIRSLNPQFKSDVVPGEYKSYAVNLPSGSATSFHVNKESIYAHKAEEFLVHRKVVDPKEISISTTITRYKVRKGESLSSIASKNGVTTKQIRQWNRLKSNRVQSGQVLAIHKRVSKPKTVKQKEEPTAETTYYANNAPKPSLQTEEREITSEQSNILSEYFSKKKNAPEGQEQPADEDDFDDTGANLATRTPNEAPTIYHKVRMGETVALIASKYNVDKDDVAKWNKLKTAIPKIGQRLVIHLPSTPEVETDQDVIFDMEQANKQKLVTENISNNNISSEYEASQKYRGKQSSTPSMLNAKEESKLQKKDTKQAKSNLVSKESKKKKEKPKKPATYTVKRGDTLGHIASRFGSDVTASGIKKANKLKTDKLKVGQKLKIPR